MLEFGLGCDDLCHIDDEINGVISEGDDDTASTGIGQTFRQMGKTADEISKLSYEYYEKELSCFREPLRRVPFHRMNWQSSSDVSDRSKFAG